MGSGIGEEFQRGEFDPFGDLAIAGGITGTFVRCDNGPASSYDPPNSIDPSLP